MEEDDEDLKEPEDEDLHNIEYATNMKKLCEKIGI